VIAVRDHLDELAPSQVVVVTFTAAEQLRAYHDRLMLSFPILSDPDRVFYRAFELGRGSWRRIYSVGTLRMYARLLRRGRRMHRPTEDTRQLGGDFIIDTHGRVAYVHNARGPDDRPSIETLIAALAACRE